MVASEPLTREEMVTLKTLVKEVVNLASVVCVGDFYPCSTFTTSWAIRKKMHYLSAKMNLVAQVLI